MKKIFNILFVFFIFFPNKINAKKINMHIKKYREKLEKVYKEYKIEKNLYNTKTEMQISKNINENLYLSIVNAPTNLYYVGKIIFLLTKSYGGYYIDGIEYALNPFYTIEKKDNAYYLKRGKICLAKITKNKIETKDLVFFIEGFPKRDENLINNYSNYVLKSSIFYKPIELKQKITLYLIYPTIKIIYTNNLNC